MAITTTRRLHDYPGYDGGAGGSRGGDDGGYGYGYGYGYGGESYVSWFPIAFTPTSEFPAEYADGMPTGTASFDGTMLTWTSTFNYPTYTYAYMDPSCGYDGGVPEPYTTTVVDGDEDTGGWDSDWGDPMYDTHASGFPGSDSLPCVAVSWGYYDGYTGDEDVDVGDETDWGEEEPPSSSSIPLMDEERHQRGRRRLSPISPQATPSTSPSTSWTRPTPLRPASS